MILNELGWKARCVYSALNHQRVSQGLVWKRVFGKVGFHCLELRLFRIEINLSPFYLFEEFEENTKHSFLKLIFSP